MDPLDAPKHMSGSNSLYNGLQHEQFRPFSSLPPSPRPFKTMNLEAERQSRSSETPVPETHQRPRLFHPDASLVLIGIRASGKRSLGFIAATALGRRFVTEDFYFQSVNGLSRQDYLKIHGSEQFHKQDIETSKKMLEDNKFKCVIDCGLGSLTSGLQEYLRQYSLTNPIVYVVRDMEQIKASLNLDERAAKLLEHGNATHRRCSNFEFYNLEDDAADLTPEADSTDRASPFYSFKLRNLQADFSQFVRFITGTPREQPTLQSPFLLDGPLEQRVYTHALFVKLSSFIKGKVNFESLESAGDIIEVYVDQWGSLAMKQLSKMIAVIRRVLQVPVLISGSSELAHAPEQSYIAILTQSLRLGIDFISINLNLDDSQIAQISALKGHTRIIGSYADRLPNDQGWRHPKWSDLYTRAVTLKLDMVRLLHYPVDRAENDTLIWFKEETRSRTGPQIPLVAYNLGTVGRPSQMLNLILTSVTHPNLASSAGSEKGIVEPQLTSREILDALFRGFVYDPLKFLIVGANVTESLSPPMHNAAYALVGLQHHYSTKNISSWADIEDLAADDSLGGLSIVQPYKVKIVPRLEYLTSHAKAVGAVNTLVALRSDASGNVPPVQVQAQGRNRVGHISGWFGENTDFIGIMSCIGRSLSPRNVIQPKTTSLVIGAGGMARAAVYAMLQMGCKHIFVFNRTIANTKAIAAHFNNWARSNGHAQDPVKLLETLSDAWPASYAHPTVIISCVTHELLDGNPGADFRMPAEWLEAPSGGVVVEMAYMTKETPLIKQMKAFRQQTGRPWVLVDGIETLIEQALAQFESMTGRKAPKRCMTEAIRQSIERKASYLVDGEEFFT